MLGGEWPYNDPSLGDGDCRVPSENNTPKLDKGATPCPTQLRLPQNLIHVPTCTQHPDSIPDYSLNGVNELTKVNEGRDCAGARLLSSTWLNGEAEQVTKIIIIFFSFSSVSFLNFIPDIVCEI